MGKTRAETGELILLGVFALFTLAFLLDVRGMPLEGKLLSYIAAPFIFCLILLCAVLALRPAKKEAGADRTSEAADEGEGLEGEELREHRRLARKQFHLTVALACLLFASILLFGFYIGSGLILFLWFLVFRKLSWGTLALSVLGPSFLYVAFELLLQIGLPHGAVLTWLGH